IREDFDYYSNLYLKIIDEDIFNKSYGQYVFYNRLNEQNRQYLLIMSACTCDDPNEEIKIKEVSKLFDRHFVLLQLFGCYDSNSFTDSIVYLNNAIRNKDIEEIKDLFLKRLIEDINKVKNIGINDLFHYSLFKDRNNNLPIRFIRYFFARIENYISSSGGFEELSKNQFYDLVRNKGHVNGYHIEHILSNNDENRSLFNNDEEVFQNERNRLGALLLLKGKDNISSSNELYINKLKTYSSSNLWNRTLISDFYHTNKDFHQFINNEGLDFKPYNKFDGDAVEERQKLLFDIVKKIWG
ncbi:MAG: GmrSD restriction endonuclease domain-containing protein, partial [archaeon]